MNIYGIKTCDTCRKALKILKENEINFIWHDLKTEAIPDTIMARLIKGHVNGSLNAVNKSSKTWREMSDGDKTAINAGDPDVIANVLAANPLLVKRPLIDHCDTLTCGFTDEVLKACKEA